jgi:hypothetical protein
MVMPAPPSPEELAAHYKKYPVPGTTIRCPACDGNTTVFSFNTTELRSMWFCYECMFYFDLSNAIFIEVEDDTG